MSEQDELQKAIQVTEITLVKLERMRANPPETGPAQVNAALAEFLAHVGVRFKISLMREDAEELGCDR